MKIPYSLFFILIPVPVKIPYHAKGSIQEQKYSEDHFHFFGKGYFRTKKDIESKEEKHTGNGDAQYFIEFFHGGNYKETIQ
jgi:hypothetical protein